MIILDVNAWLAQLLTTDTELAALVGEDRIFDPVAPEDTPYPFVVFSYTNEGKDVYGAGKVRIMSELVYEVKGVCEGASYAPLEDIAGRIDALLHGASGETTAVRILSCMRQAPLAQAEIDEDARQYRHLGGLYRLQVQPA